MQQLYLANLNPRIRFPGGNKFNKKSKSRKRYQEYCNATDLKSYFAKGGTVQDYRNDLARGVFHFEHPNLWNLQHKNGADWTLLRSGGEKIDRQSFFNFMKLW